jgi:hypothetical protein
MDNSYVIETTSVGVLENCYLLLDTNFLFDGLLFPTELAELLAKLSDLSCNLITTRSVIIEFLGGTPNDELYDKKTVFLEQLFGKELGKIVSLPIEAALPNKEDFLVFSRQCNKFSYVDFEMYLTLKKYKHSKILMASRNHRDFTTAIFNRKGFMTLLSKKEIRTYGLYSSK